MRIYSFFFGGGALHWPRSIRLVQGSLIFVLVHILSYDTFEEITMLHEIQIEEPLRCIVEARKFAVASFSFYCVRCVARASPLGSLALCLSWLPPPMSLERQSHVAPRRHLGSFLCLAAISNPPTPPPHTHTHIDTRTHTHTHQVSC